MKTLTTVLILALPFNSLAASLIESRDAQGHQSRIYVEGDKARMETPQAKGYMVLDADNQTMKAVIHDQRMIMDMSNLLQTGVSSGNTEKVKSQLKTKGPGPDIAGYTTREYALYANGDYCGSAFVSVGIMEDLKLNKLAGAMQTFSNQIQQRMAGMNMSRMLKPCEHARKDLGGRLQDVGFPLRLTNEKKRLISEVTRIDKSAKLPANAFSIPSDYRVINPDKMMEQMPQMKEMIKNMPPEAMDAMRKRMQQMYQQ